MGYSCSAKASYVLTALEEIIASQYPDQPTNFLPGEGGSVGFWEIGRENRDNSITGKVYFSRVENGLFYIIGRFKIDRDGKIVRFPRLARNLKIQAQELGIKRYNRIYDINFYKVEFESLKRKLFGSNLFVVIDETSEDAKRYKQLLGLFHPEYRSSDWFDPRFDTETRTLGKVG